MSVDTWKSALDMVWAAMSLTETIATTATTSALITMKGTTPLQGHRQYGEESRGRPSARSRPLWTF